MREIAYFNNTSLSGTASNETLGVRVWIAADERKSPPPFFTHP